MNNITSMQHPKAKPKCYTQLSRVKLSMVQKYIFMLVKER